MKTVIVGGGAVGFQLAQQLIRENQDVVLIESEPEQARILSNRLDCMVVNGPGNNLEILREAGTADADYFVAVTTSDEINMISCALVSSEFTVPNKIARVRNIEYSGTRLAGAGFLGIDHVVNPEIETAREIVTSIDQGALSDVMSFEKSNLQMQSLTVAAHSPIINKYLHELGRFIDVPFLIALIVRDNSYIIPSGESRIQEGDQIYVVATAENNETVFEHLGKAKTALNKVVLVGGGGKIGQLIAEHMLEGTFHGYGATKKGKRKKRKGQVNLKIVERDYQKCKDLANRFRSATAIHADITDESLFQEEQFASSDLVVAVTDNQELNIVTALYARSVGIQRTVALVNNTGYAEISTKLGIDVAISLKKAMVDAILKIIRKGSVHGLHSLSGGQIEVLEFIITPNAPVLGKELRHVKLPPGSLIVSFTHSGTTSIPDGQTTLNAGDDLVVISRQEHFGRIEAIFAPQDTKA